MVGFNFTAEYVAKRRATALRNTLLASVRAIADCEGALPDTYGMKAKELVELLDGLRLQYGATNRSAST
jgi:hypothetical protein